VITGINIDQSDSFYSGRPTKIQKSYQNSKLLPKLKTITKTLTKTQKFYQNSKLILKLKSLTKTQNFYQNLKVLPKLKSSTETQKSH
ncbi:10242_t:CDS:2, partial [Racocetra fulgida]